MAISNTNILIKRSTTNASPGTLKAGELGYSYLSNTVYIGTSAGNGVLKIGGQYYTNIIDNATNLATPNTIALGDATGNIQFNYVSANIIGAVSGGANTALYLQNPQPFSISGGDIFASSVVFNGDNSINLTASLNTVPGLVSGYYGGATQSSSTIPVIQVAANGRIMSIANTTVTSSFNISDGSTSNTIYSGSTFYHTGTKGITTAVTGNTVTFGTDNTVLRSNNSTVGLQTISTDLTVAGNLIVAGTQTFVNTATVQTNDSLIYLAANNNVGDVVDIGFYGASNTGSSVTYSGLIREGSGGSAAGNFFLFKNLATAPTGNTINYSGATAANLVAGNVSATTLYSSNGAVSTGIYTGSYSDGVVIDYNTSSGTGRFIAGPGDGLAFYNNGPASPTTLMAINSAGNITTGVWQATTIGTAYGGTNNTSYTNNQITYYNGTGIVSLANTGTAGTYGNAAYIPVVTTDGYGRVSGVTNTAIAIDTSQITSGTLGYTRGGTGSTSYTTGTLLVSGATGFQSLSNTTFSQTGTGAQNNTITSVTVDAYGRFTAATYQAISGLTVGQGGTGVNTFTTNGITYGNGTGAMQVTAAAGVADQTWSNQILTVTNAGVPVWSTALDGGTF
jgi:hypothetical protein